MSGPSIPSTPSTMPSAAQIAAPPGESPLRTSARRILATAVVMLAVAILVDAAAVVGLDRRPLNHGYRVIRTKWALLAEQKTPVDTLILGDSTGNQGLVPDILSARLGGDALNLCTVGDLLAVNDAWMLARYLRDVGTPRRVVIIHAFDVWGRESNPDAIAQVPLPMGFWKDADPKISMTTWEYGRVLLDRYVPIYSQDQTLSRLFRQPRKTLARGFDMDSKGFLHARKGFPKEVLKDSAFQIAEIERQKGDPPISAENLQALGVLAHLAETHRFDIYISASPLYEGLYENPAFRKRFGHLTDALTEFAAAHPRVRLLPGPEMTFPAEQMSTVDHLVEDAARVFTGGVAEKIAVASAQPPAFAENPPSGAPAR